MSEDADSARDSATDGESEPSHYDMTIDAHGVHIRVDWKLGETTEDYTWNEIQEIRLNDAAIDTHIETTLPAVVTIDCPYLEITEGEFDTPFGGRWDRLRDATGITYYANGNIEFSDRETAIEQLRQLVIFLYREGHITEEDTPIPAPYSTEKCLLAFNEPDGGHEAIDLADTTAYVPAKSPEDYRKREAQYLIEEYALSQEVADDA